jgi:hypothetical protein
MRLRGKFAPPGRPPPARRSGVPNREATRPSSSSSHNFPQSEHRHYQRARPSPFDCLISSTCGCRRIHSFHLIPPRSFMSLDVAAESIAKMGPDEESADSQSRASKQARIRDNQRRSRARRQEHLQDLERRLSECHITCREAELRLNAFKELQLENARLRQLLEILGVNENLINTFVHQDATAAPDSSSGSALRQLKPKIALAPHLAKPSPAGKYVLPTNDQSTSLAALSPASTTTSSQPASLFSTLSSSLGTNTPRRDTPGTTPTSFPVHEPFRAHQYLSQFHGGTMFAGDVFANEPFSCMVFGNKATGPLQASHGNTVLCSLAKEMVDQYNINEEDLEQIKARLAAGFAAPAHPGESCRVNNQLLFEVLNDVSGRLS